MSEDSRASEKAGAYARKQLFSSCRLLTWSHSARFDMGVRLAQRFGASRLLDYGCGDGTFLARVSPNITAGVGAEVDPGLVVDCTRRYAQLENLSFVTVDELAHHPNESFDTVFCMEVLEHCTSDAVERVLRDVHRLVSRSGVVVISVPIETGPPLILKQAARAVLARTLRGDYALREKYSAREMLRMLAPGESSPVERPMYGAAGTTGGLREASAAGAAGAAGAPPYQNSEAALGESMAASARSYHGHKGFNWRTLRRRMSGDFDIIEQKYSPVGVHPWLNSQAWLVCRRRA
jgi:2-polyprenyl-3-methyl-5-hydroxy-6-metoxy-1,4-benzoquinol methylase